MVTKCNRKENITTNRASALAGIKHAANKMVERSCQKFQPLSAGQAVLIPVPLYDRSPVDEKNLLGRIIDVVNDRYLVGTSKGTLKGRLAQNGFEATTVAMTDDIPPERYTLRELAAKHSIVGGQGIRRCTCKTQCDTNRCRCKKANIPCNSKCHSSLACKNNQKTKCWS